MSPQKSGPQKSLVVRRIVDVLLVAKESPAALLGEVMQVDARPPETQATGGPQIGQQAFEDSLVPAIVAGQATDGELFKMGAPNGCTLAPKI